MTQTMTWAGLDVHARSTHAAAIDVRSGELLRARLGGDVELVVEWLCGLAGPVHAVYEAGPTGYGLARLGAQRGLRIDVIAPGKTPRAAAERIKTDRRDAEVLVRQLMAGTLCPIYVPSPALEAARDLVRAREDVRCDLSRARHRVSKLLLRHGEVYPKDQSTWTTRHRKWLSSRRFDESNTELAYIDALAAVDGLTHRRDARRAHRPPARATQLWAAPTQRPFLDSPGRHRNRVMRYPTRGYQTDHTVDHRPAPTPPATSPAHQASRRIPT